MPQKLINLFNVTNGHELDLLSLDPTGPDDPSAVAYVSRSSKNNGVLAYVKRLDDVEPAAADTLSLAVGGSACATFLQPRPYYTAQNVRVLAPKRKMTNNEKLWWALCIWHNRYRFNYGRHANRTYRDLALPDRPPPWVRRVSSPDFSRLGEPASQHAAGKIDPAKWEDFRLGSLFDVVRGRYVPVAEKRPGSTPEVSSMTLTNGIGRYIDLPPEHPASVISVARNGSPGTAFLQPRTFFATDDAYILHPKTDIPPAALLFVCTLIRRERFRFNYGRKWSINKMRAWSIRLPYTRDRTPDWLWMARYMTALDFSAAAFETELC